MSAAESVSDDAAELPHVDDVSFSPEVYADIEAAADIETGVLTRDDLSEVHPELPEGWRGSMAGIKNRGGPWWCESCEGPSMLCYKCSRCGRVESGDGSTHGRQSG